MSINKWKSEEVRRGCQTTKKVVNRIWKRQWSLFGPVYWLLFTLHVNSQHSYTIRPTMMSDKCSFLLYSCSNWSFSINQTDQPTPAQTSRPCRGKSSLDYLLVSSDRTSFCTWKSHGCKGGIEHSPSAAESINLTCLLLQSSLTEQSCVLYTDANVLTLELPAASHTDVRQNLVHQNDTRRGWKKTWLLGVDGWEGVWTDAPRQ